MLRLGGVVKILLSVQEQRFQLHAEHNPDIVGSEVAYSPLHSLSPSYFICERHDMAQLFPHVDYMNT